MEEFSWTPEQKRAWYRLFKKLGLYEKGGETRDAITVADNVSSGAGHRRPDVAQLPGSTAPGGAGVVAPEAA